MTRNLDIGPRQEPPPPPQGDDAQRQCTNMLVLLVVVGIVAVSVVLLLWMKHDNDIQDCIAAHHPNCVPVETGQ